MQHLHDCVKLRLLIKTYKLNKIEGFAGNKLHKISKRGLSPLAEYNNDLIAAKLFKN